VKPADRNSLATMTRRDTPSWNLTNRPERKFARRRLGSRAYDPPVNVRSMRPDELDAAVSVWRAANVARGAPHGPQRTARIRAKLSASDALAFVALRPEIVGMALAEPGRFDDGAGEPDPSLLHISMVFVRPAAQRTGVGLPLVLHILDVARSLGYQRVGVWTAEENTPARKLYERAGMTLTGKTAPLRSSLALQYESFLNGEAPPRPEVAK
jgi:ribosomal protein S18 acetylase RimI-like enzyme